jgi:general L-amino acid transport system permease protein
MLPAVTGPTIPTLKQPRVAGQLVFAVLLLALVVMAVATVTANIERRNIATGFDFLFRPASFNIGESFIDVRPTDSYGRALFAAFLNTLAVSIAASLLATVLGVVLAAAGKAGSPMLNRLIAVYVEIFRNTPLLLQLLLWYTLVQTLPPVAEAIGIGSLAFISQRGIAFPALSLTPAAVLALLAAAGLWALAARMQRVSNRGALRVGLLAGSSILLGAVAIFGVAFDMPQQAGFGFKGGWRLSPEFLALLLGLTLYSAAFVAEIVRSGINAVPVGQWEAASSLGLSRYRCFRLIILPQATRVAIPPLISEYGGIVKNSSLAVAIGYPDLVWAANTTITQTGQAIEGVAILMAGYLSVSLVVSAFLNIFNKRFTARYA